MVLTSGAIFGVSLSASRTRTWNRFSGEGTGVLSFICDLTHQDFRKRFNVSDQRKTGLWSSF